MHIAILNNRVTRYDAVSTDALLQMKSLQTAGYEVRIFAQSWEDAGTITHLNELNKFCYRKIDLIILHYSTAWTEVMPLLGKFPGRIIIKYHNITPERFFLEYNEVYAASSKVGIEGLQELTARLPEAILWADSEFNAQNLKSIAKGSLSFDKSVQIMPPLHQVDVFSQSEADLNMLQNLHTPPLDYVLSVGRLVPNKGHVVLLKSFSLYKKFHNPDAYLMIAGKIDPQLSKYNQELNNLIQDEELDDAVVFLEGLSSAELKACYLSARLLVMTSEHEGFGVPLIEAQALGLPILALDRAAVSNTVGDGALVFEEDKPEILASAMDRIIRDVDLQHQLRDMGLVNYRERFASEILQSYFLETIKKFVS